MVLINLLAATSLKGVRLENALVHADDHNDLQALEGADSELDAEETACAAFLVLAVLVVCFAVVGTALVDSQERCTARDASLRHAVFTPLFTPRCAEGRTPPHHFEAAWRAAGRARGAIGSGRAAGELG